MSLHSQRASMTDTSSRGTTTRRRVLLGAGVGATVALAGCTSGSSEGAENVPVRGNADAEVTLEVFEDLGCPACRSYVLNQFSDIQQTYLNEGLIRYEHRDYIVTGVAARHAASAAREVLERHGDEAFWEFVEALYSNQNRLRSERPALFGELAGTLGLDADAVQTAGADRSHDSAVDADIERGDTFGVSGTPSFVVDEELVDTSNARNIRDVVGLVSQELDQALTNS